MLERIRLTNFKCFEDLNLRCAPLNLLCGLNGMGKSSVIQALLVLRQSFLSGELQDGHLVLGGSLADLGAGSDVLFEDATNDVVGLELVDLQAGVWRAEFVSASTSDQLTTAEGEHTPTVTGPWTEAPPFGGPFAYVQAERVGPRKSYPLSEVSARRRDLGSRGEYAWNYLVEHWGDLLPRDDQRLVGRDSRRLADIVDAWLQEVSPGVHLRLDRIASMDAVIAGFSFDRPGDIESRRHRAANVGFGLSYALPVIVAMLMPPGALCLIENPVAHLHPQGQTKLAGLAVRAALAGVQVVVETHSDHFVDGVRIAVHDGLLEPAAAAIHYFERSNGQAVVSSPALDEDGRLSHWPVGFFDQHEENLARLLTPRS